MSERGAAVRAILIRSGFKVDAATAVEILDRLEELGWARPEMVRVLVASAGGRVIIPDRIMTDPPKTLTTWREERMSSTVVAAS